ncbi:MAG: deoxynucleoside kinase [Bacteroidales bacterium]|nr:deoxynucleoside kinase [Candidatus Colimorpha onthohippi]
MHIAIAGNIGSGKTTLTQLLSKHYGYHPMYETSDSNPYINSFYEDMRRWSFNIQIHFLHTRVRQLLDNRQKYANIIQDRTLYEDAYIFAPNLHAMGLMNTRDFENYMQTFELISSFIEPPDLLIYLRGDIPSLIRQIQHRGREYENAIRLDYLTSLNNRYEHWIESFNKCKVLTIDITNTNFADNPEDLGIVINKIDAEYNSLFSGQQ